VGHENSIHSLDIWKKESSLRHTSLIILPAVEIYNPIREMWVMKTPSTR